MDPQHYFIRPSPEVHSVAELIAHGTAWRKDAIVKIETGRGDLTEADKADWPDLEELKLLGWEEIYSEYADSVNQLIRLLEGKDDPFLEEMYFDPEFDGDFPFSFTLIGILQHDIYHLGQLGLVIRMIRGS